MSLANWANQYLRRTPLVSQLFVGTRMLTWTVAITSSWAFLPLGLAGPGIEIPIWILGLTVVGSLLYVGTIGFGVMRVGGLHGISLLCLIPLFATLEHVVPLYSLWKRERDFVVIDK